MTFQVLKNPAKTPVLLVSPETGRLPPDMGTMAQFISGKSGGLGEVITSLCEGLTERGIDCHLATINLKRRFQKESSLDEAQWQELCHKVDPARVHLISSAIFADLPSPYSGNPLLNAVEYQRQMINHVIKGIRARYEGRLILHSHDWMAGGAVTAYAKSRGCPVLHTVHNVHTAAIPFDMYFGVDLDGLSPYLYCSRDNGKTCIDSQATAIKNASLINFVGEKFLQELLDGFFLDQQIIPVSLRREVKAKHNHGCTLSILNAPSLNMYPENCRHLVCRYGPNENVLQAKRRNLVEFQKRTGLNIDPEAILFFWPSRLDPAQKGVEILEDIALKFVIEHGDVQMAVVGDGVGHDKTHEKILGKIAWASGGKIAYHRFREGLSMLGYAAASDVFGASLYEPCGQIDQIGNLFGATATNRDTGGYHDKIREIDLGAGSPRSEGNGFLFRDYDPGGLWHGLEKSVRFHRMNPEVRESRLKRIMKETREKYSLDSMINQYVRVYERLNGGRPLA